MLAKMTSKNQLTLPKAVLKGLRAEYFEVEQVDGKIILTPVNTRAAEEVREKVRQFGITEDDIADALAWSRK
jgi:hypothetical protein